MLGEQGVTGKEGERGRGHRQDGEIRRRRANKQDNSKHGA